VESVVQFLLAPFPGIDLSDPFVEAARYLTARTGQSDRISFQTANALNLPFNDSTFDVVLLQHVAMKIADRPSLYEEIRRVLTSGGRFATFDVVQPIDPSALNAREWHRGIHHQI
jgi:sarcosine/dimethylglycine N-methyltransferase